MAASHRDDAWHDGDDAAIASCLPLIRHGLPEGAEIVLDAGPCAPGDRYWLVRTAKRFVALIPQSAPLGALPELTRLRDAIARRERLPDGTAVTAIGLLLPAQQDWPALRRPVAGFRPAIVNRTTKIMVFPVDPRTGAVAAVIKWPKRPGVQHRCRHEFALLSELAATGSDLGPAPLAADAERFGFSYAFLPGQPLADLAVPPPGLAALFGGLGGAGCTTLRAHAQRLAIRADRLDLEPGSKARVLRLLDGIRDGTPVANGITHGDLKPGNLVHGPDGRLRAIDWELAARDGLPLLDAVRLSFFEATERPPTARTLSEFFFAAGRQRLDRLLHLVAPGPRPALQELLALFFGGFYLDRFELLDGPGAGVIRYLDGILANAGPAA